MTDSKATPEDYMVRFNNEVKTSEDSKESELEIERQETKDDNYNPEAFKELEKKYDEEEYLLSKLRFKSEQDKYVFEHLPLLPTQKLSLVYQLIVDKDDCVEVDDDLREKIMNVVK